MVDVAYIALGSNLGDRAQQLADARAALGALPSSQVIAESSVEETDPIGPAGQGPYLNQMVALRTPLAPRELLGELQAIERAQGRVRRERWAARTIDLDIVCFDDRSASEEGLMVPHPELVNRDFWRRELEEIRSSLRAAATPESVAPINR